MWSTQHYRHLVRVSGWYDLIVTAAFVTPWTFLALHGLLQGWGQAMGLAGTLPSFAPLHVLMANLMGSIVCVWAVLRIRDPQPVFGRYDAVGRMLFATWQAYALSQGASAFIAVILFFEIAWAIAQSLPIKDGQLPSEQGAQA
ncbi:hypothetical protein [Pseudomonas asplenii]|uniref:Uncharacterized protein n=1 Tax=Pseudomonas asplenii TaxID=53407 RepID=A0A1H6P686_9PSED|nr:hypothetical protein [Pseudomonas fuscovaginae]SEI24984.1 hypothetical protein SAMN05216581_5713 [Pseudomonas fuscovaginae]